MEGDFELMSDLPIHRGEASMSVNDVDEEVKVLSDYTKQVTRITILVAIASLVVAALSMWWCASIVAYAAFCIPFVTAPAVVIQRLRIQWMPTLRQELNRIRSSVNDFAYENVRLQAENTRLEQQASKLSDVENRLSEITKKEGKNLDEFKGLLQEHASIQKEMEELLQAQEFQSLISAFMASEVKVDNNISEKELNKFMRRLKGLHADRQSSYIDEEAIRDAFSRTSQSPQALLEITTSYLSSKSEQEE